MPGTYEKQHAKVLRIEVSIGNDDDTRSLEQFERDVKEALQGELVNAHNVVAQGGYYIIDGKVCLTKDYDPKTKNRVPGTHPPVWAGGPAPVQAPKVETFTDEAPTPKYERIEGFKKPERDPLTGRKVRSDKGKPRGPRKPKEVDNG